MSVHVTLTKKSGKSTKQIMQKLNRDIISAAERTVKDGTLDVHNDAKLSIQAVSPGERQTRYDPKRTVTASKVGDAPNTDQGQAISSISFNITKTLIEVIGRVGTNLTYLAAFEFNGRPWLRPAAKKNEKNIDKNIKIRLQKAARKNGIN